MVEETRGEDAAVDRPAAPSRAARMTIRDVAKLAGVTASTVSRALDSSRHDLVTRETRARIEGVVREIGYRPHLVARDFRLGQTMSVGVVVPDLANPIFAPFARGIAHALESGGHLPLVADTEDDHDRLIRVMERFVERRVAVIIVAAGRAIDAEILMRVHREGTPIIAAIRRPPGLHGVPTVRHDDRTGVALAVEHLHGLGHRRIGQVRGPEDIEPFPERDRGFVAAMQSYGLTPAGASSPTAQITIDAARTAAHTLFQGERADWPTALFVPNDTMALGVLDAVRACGLRCPEDVSIVSYNDVFFAPYVNPPLTAVHLPVYELGHISGELALRLIDEPGELHAVETPPPVLRVRGSSGPVAASQA